MDGKGWKEGKLRGCKPAGDASCPDVSDAGLAARRASWQPLGPAFPGASLAPAYSPHLLLPPTDAHARPDTVASPHKAPEEVNGLPPENVLLLFPPPLLSLDWPTRLPVQAHAQSTWSSSRIMAL